MVSYSSLLNVRWLVPATPHARAPIVYPSASSHLRMCRSLKSPSPTYHKRLVVPESPTAQDMSAEEQQQPEDHNTEDKTNEEHPPPSDTEDEKMYQDADEVESFRAESLILTGRLRALLEHLGITIAPQYQIKEVPRSGRVEFKAIAEIFFGSRILC
jgi:hypothetical protein